MGIVFLLLSLPETSNMSVVCNTSSPRYMFSSISQGSCLPKSEYL